MMMPRRSGDAICFRVRIQNSVAVAKESDDQWLDQASAPYEWTNT